MRWLIVLLLISFSVHAKVDSDCLVRASGEKALKGRLANNDFRRERGFLSYSNLLQGRGMPTLSEFLGALKKRQVYLDAGAGNAVAVREILEEYKQLHAVAAAYKKPESESLEEDLRVLKDRFHYVDGGFIEHMVNDSDPSYFHGVEELCF